jgi:phenylalanyl-tRNA synthetase beta chain
MAESLWVRTGGEGLKMRFTLSWLKEHLKTEASLTEIIDRLTQLGLVVEKVENKAEALAPFIICEIVEAEKHPNADRLQVCKVNTGKETLQIVCGGANARFGLKTVLARPGDVIPSTGQVLKVGKVRDVESFGMLCSSAELRLSGESEGIIEVDPAAPVGESYAKWLALDDPIIEIEISPNRGDCLGVYGVARDLAATGIGKLLPLKQVTIKGSFPNPVKMTSDPEACPHFTGVVIRGVKNDPSPAWLRNKLEAIGLRSISTLVDITNYFTFDRGRPLHVFDLDKLKGDLTIRFSKPGETFEGLDGKTYTLKEEMGVIADDTGVISLAGIMGNVGSSCDDNTTNVFLEAAWFDPIRTAITGRELGVLSDARYRFERTVDPESTLPGVQAGAQMIIDLCGGEASDVLQVGKPIDFKKNLKFNVERIQTLGGCDIPLPRVKEILNHLGFEVKGEGSLLTIQNPSWRPDFDHDADFVEEVLRIEGYDSIPSVPYSERPEGKPLEALQTRRFEIRDRLAGRGLVEAVTWSFISQKEAQPFGPIHDSLILLNPISQDATTMRPSIFPSLLKAVLNNQNRGIDSAALFEIAPQYTDASHQGQHMMATGIRVGNFAPYNWSQSKRTVDLYDAKADALVVLDMSIQLDGTAPSWYHPGRSATLKLGNLILGYFGEIHPRILKYFDVKGPAVGFEIFIDRIPLPKKKTTAKPKLTLSPYQSVERDFAFVVGREILAETLIKAATKADPGLIEDISVFDVFEMADGRKSLGIRLRLQPKDHTLTDEEIQAFSQKVITGVIQSTGGSLRQ